MRRRNDLVTLRTRHAAALASLAALWVCLAPTSAHATLPDEPPIPADRRPAVVEPVLRQGLYELRLGVGGHWLLYGVGRNILEILGQVGGSVEVGYLLTESLELQGGIWGGDQENYTSVTAFAVAKYRWLHLHDRLKPFLFGGLQHQWLFPSNGKDRRTITGLGARLGTGVDVVLTPRLVFGIQGAFDLGPRLLPLAGVLASFKLTGHVGFFF